MRQERVSLTLVPPKGGDSSLPLSMGWTQLLASVEQNMVEMMAYVWVLNGIPAFSFWIGGIVYVEARMQKADILASMNQKDHNPTLDQDGLPEFSKLGKPSLTA
jgi:hypothetical protein